MAGRLCEKHRPTRTMRDENYDGCCKTKNAWLMGRMSNNQANGCDRRLLTVHTRGSGTLEL
jgi:hypothetical protein